MRSQGELILAALAFGSLAPASAFNFGAAAGRIVGELAPSASPTTPADPFANVIPSPTCVMEDWDSQDMWREDAYSAFVDHMSAPRSGTDAYLYDRIKHIYSNQSVVMTQDRYFNILGYSSSAQASGSFMMRPIEDFDRITKVIYAPASRRRDGDGRVGESLVFAGYEIGWKDYEFKAVVATWVDGFSVYTQWHIIGENKKAALELIHAVGAWSSKLREVVLVFNDGYWQPDHNLWLGIQSASWKDVILDEGLKKKVQHDYRSFFQSEKIYKDLNVPWKRGLIFLGPPGNGKTVSLKAIMKELDDMPILYVKSFHTYQGDEFGIRQIFMRARQEAPCVLVMEDLDSLITDQNRSFFLNEVDGIEDNDGLLLIGTTNHFDRLDPALSNRPSRFDRKYAFPNPNRNERRAYAVYWQKKLASNKDIDFPDSLLDEIADQTDKFSFAYLKEAFVSALLTLAGREDAPEELGLPFRDVLLEQIKTLRESLENDRDTLRVASGKCGGSCADAEGDFFQSFQGGPPPPMDEDDMWPGDITPTVIFGDGTVEKADNEAPWERRRTKAPIAWREDAQGEAMEECGKGVFKLISEPLSDGKQLCVGFRDDGKGGMTRIPDGEAIPTGGVELTGEESDRAHEKMIAAIKADQAAGRHPFRIVEE